MLGEEGYQGTGLPPATGISNIGPYSCMYSTYTTIGIIQTNWNSNGILRTGAAQKMLKTGGGLANRDAAEGMQGSKYLRRSTDPAYRALQIIHIRTVKPMNYVVVPRIAESTD